MNWPAQSPDLSPIENLLYELGRRSIRPKGKQEPLNMIQEERKQIPPPVYQNILERVPRRLNAVTVPKGVLTTY